MRRKPRSTDTTPSVGRDEGLVAQAVEVLLHADEVQRPAVVRHFTTYCLAEGMRLLSERLVDRLVRDAVGGQVVACLAEIGVPAAAALTDRLATCRAAGVQVRLAEALTVVGRRLRPESRARFLFDVAIAREQVRDQQVREAITRTIAVLGWARQEVPGVDAGRSDRGQADT
jgi:hypothetical protein